MGGDGRDGRTMYLIAAADTSAAIVVAFVALVAAGVTAGATVIAKFRESKDARSTAREAAAQTRELGLIHESQDVLVAVVETQRAELVAQRAELVAARADAAAARDETRATREETRAARAELAELRVHVDAMRLELAEALRNSNDCEAARTADARLIAELRDRLEQEGTE